MHDTKKLESELEALVEMMKEYDRHGDMWTRRGLDHLKALKNMSNTYDKAQGVKREIAQKAYEKAFRNASHDMQMASEFVAESEKSEKALSQILKLDYIDKLKQLSKVIKALRTSTSNYEINVESVKGIFEKAVKLTKQANK